MIAQKIVLPLLYNEKKFDFKYQKKTIIISIKNIENTASRNRTDYLIVLFQRISHL